MTKSKESRGTEREWRESETALAAVREQIYGNKLLRRILTRAAKRGAKFLPSSGNLGDGLIQLGNFDYFEHIGWQPEIISLFSPADMSSSEIIVLGGGGGWKEGLLEEQARSLRPFLEGGGELILLPSSIEGFKEFFARYAKQVTLFVREKVSASNLRLAELDGRVHLCPDMAFAARHHWFAPYGERAGTGTLHIHRTDGESLLVDLPPANIDLPLLWNGVEWSTRQACLGPLLGVAHLISQFAIVDTDRLHMAALSAMLNRNVVMRPNSYFKNRAVYEYSLSTVSAVTFCSETGGAADEHQGTAMDTLGDQATRKSANASVNDELVTLARLRREYFEPELIRLRRATSEYEKTKSEWFEPELLRLRAENETLRGQLNESEQARGALEGERANRYEPELARLREEVNERDKVKVEWFEPELKRLHAASEESQAKLIAAERSLCALEGQAIQRHQELQRLTAENQRLAQELATETAKSQKTQSDLSEQQRLRSEVDEPEIQRLRIHIRRLQEELESLSLDRAGLMKRLESEIHMLRSNIRRSNKNDTQVLRQRVLHYAEQLAKRHAAFVAMETRLAEFDQLREHWYNPELARLTQVIQEQDKIRLEWFEPRLSYFQARTEELESALQKSDHVRATWFEPQLAQRAERIAELEQMIAAAPRWRRVLRRLTRATRMA